MALFKDFRDFALRGNVLDLAIGVIIGAAFGRIVTSMVEDILMPPLGLIINGIDFSKSSLILREATVGPDGKEIAPVAVRYGNFLQNVIQFTIVAFCIFLITRLIMKISREKEAKVEVKPAGPPELSTQEKLLVEIRDALTSGRAVS